MRTKILAAILTLGFLAAIPATSEAGPVRFGRTTRRVVNNYRRDVRQVQRQTTRSFNQLDRAYRRTPVYRGSSRLYNRGFGYPSSGLYLGGSRGGVFIRF